jgi:glycosyltransferase involved in cell wall biosynthesis
MAPVRDSSRIRVCHVQSVPLMAGAQRVMFEIVRRLDPRRFERHAVCNAEGPLTAALRDEGVECHLVPPLRRSINPWRDVQAYRELRSLFQELRPDVVHTHSTKPGILGRLAAWHAGVPAVLHHVHGFAFHEQTPRPLFYLGKLAERYAAWHCDRLVFLNEDDRAWSVESGVAQARQCTVIHNGVDVRSFGSKVHRAAERANLGLADDELMILVSGRVAAQKQPLIIPRIARKLEKLVPDRSWKIVIAGSGPLDTALDLEIVRTGTSARIRRIDWHDDPAALMQAADLVLQPSLWEGLPLSLIEASASGKPIVASDIRGNRDVVGGEAGILCAPQDESAYAVELARLIQCPRLRLDLGVAGRRRAQALFDADVNYARVAALYESLLGRAETSMRKAA